MHALAQDFRYALRQLRKSSGFSLTVVFTLALGIGATIAIFSLVEGILLRPLPFRDAERLVLLGDHLRAGPNVSVTAREISTYSTSTSAFSSMGGFAQSAYELSGGAVPEAINAARMSAEVFATLGAQPFLGRVFTRPEEEAHQPLAVISYALWLNRYRGDSQVLGRSITLNRSSYTIIGVMPHNFEFPLQTGRGNDPQIWIPLSLTADELSDAQTGFWGFQIVARMKDGVTLIQAAQDVDRVAQQVMRDFPANMSAIHIQGDVKLLHEQLIENVRPQLRTLFGAVVVVLLIACANVSGLQLVRTIRRRREYGIRLALGAASGGLLREAILEGLLLSVSGGLLGLVLAAIAIRATLRFLPDSMPRLDSISVNGSVIVFAFLVSLTAGVLSSLLPAFAAMRNDIIDALKEGIQTAAPGQAWLRSVLVVSEVGIALVLLTVSGALLRSLQRMHAVDPGFRPDHVLVAGYQLPLAQYSTQDQVSTFNRSVVDELSTQPGVASAGVTTILPSSGFSAQAAYTVEDIPIDKWKLQFAQFTVVDGDYFRAIGTPLLDGRTFTPDDRGDSLLVAVVNQTMAKHFWPGQHAVGKRFHIGNPRKGLPWATIVGVVADTKLGPRDEPTGDQLYVPARQPSILFGAAASAPLTSPTGGFLAVRSSLPPDQMVQVLRNAVAKIDPLLPLQHMQSMDAVISNVEAPRSFNTVLITAFALGALLLAITGIYAVVAFSVSQRVREIAIRMALGSQRTGIFNLVLFSGAKLAMVGCGLGVLLSLGVSRLVRSFLFDVSSTDPLIYAGSALLMILMALLASLLPAVRAASGDPVDALRTA